MVINPSTREKIENLIVKVIDEIIQRKTIREPFDMEEFTLKNPFHSALVPEEVWKIRNFERSFVTSFGMSIYQQIAKYIAEDKYGFAENGHRLVGKIYTGQLTAIQNILDGLEHKRPDYKRSPNWNAEIKEVEQATKGEIVERDVVLDLFAQSQKGETFYFEIKSSLPNSDQCKVSKEKMLKIYAMKKDENPHIYFALPDNPWIEKKKYNHPHALRWFNMREDEVVIMGKDFWDLLGGKGTYEELIRIFESVGKTTKERIRKEFLKI